MRTISATGRSAFTLVEILIVVVILGILAAMVIPAFANAAQESQVKVTLSELSKVRRHLEMYQIRHNGLTPAIAEGVGTWGDLIGDEHLKEPPTNSYIGGNVGRTIIFRDTPDVVYPAVPAYGWIYSASLDQVWAAGFDGDDMPLVR